MRLGGVGVNAVVGLREAVGSALRAGDFPGIGGGGIRGGEVKIEDIV